jgi:DNA replication and repair protein RecF
LLIKHLTLANFRNHLATEVSFVDGVNLFEGDNGQGKTNIVEAVHYLASLQSHRTAGYLPLIGWDAETAVVKAKISHAGRDVLLDLELSKTAKNRVAINKSPSNKMRDLLGYVQTVIFAPEDLDIVKKDPSNRRAFIDGLLVQLSPRFAGIFSDYDRVLKQRNTLLKSARNNAVKGSALSTLDAWDDQLITLGTQIVVARGQLMQRLNPQVVQAYQQIAVARNEPMLRMKSSLLGTGVPSFSGAGGGTGAYADADEADDLEYLDDFEFENVRKLFEERVKALRPKELERGLTLSGPQRDDLVLLLNGMPAKTYASHGEGWSYALALRLASRQLLREDSNYGDPILILDDVFAELDAKRRERLADLVADNEQVLITAAVAEDVPEALRAKVFHVEHGRVTDGGGPAGAGSASREGEATA